MNTKRACVSLKCFFVSLFLLSLTTKVTAKNGVRLNRDYVLIINSHTESTIWSNNLISLVMDHVSASGLDVFTEHMNMMVLKEAELLADFQDYLFMKYQARLPRLLILLDTPTVLLKDEIKRHWGDTPAILCAEQDYVGTFDSYFNKKALLPEERIPLSEFQDPYNVTFLHTPVYIKENVELMRYVIPNMNKLLFIADGRYINRQLDWELSRLMEEEYSQVDYELLSSDNLTTDQLMEELSCVDHFTTGVLFSSWFQTANVAGNTLLIANSHKIFAANSTAPLFSLRYPSIKSDGMIGGYTYDYDANGKKLLATITDVLGGTEPRNIPYYYPDGGFPTFNYATLLQKGLSPDVCPENSRFIAMPPTFFEENKYLLLSCLFGFVAIVYFLIQQSHTRSLRRIKDAQQKLKDTNDKLLLEKERAEEASRLKSAFLANISHEVRTPLNAIVGFSTILLSTEDEKEKQEYMAIIEKNNELLLQLISDIIDLSKIEAGNLDFIYSDIEVNELMNELLAAILPKVNKNEVALIFEPESPICYLYTDKSRLAQLLLNMLINAAKFTVEGSICFGYKKLGENKIYFYVADTGCGIPREKQEAIFKRFVKLDDFSQGTGLGLSICQVIAQQMGGEIGVESEEGKGSTFWFTLPYCKPSK